MISSIISSKFNFEMLESDEVKRLFNDSSLDQTRSEPWLCVSRYTHNISVCVFMYVF